jgi:hypothetical protein
MAFPVFGFRFSVKKRWGMGGGLLTFAGEVDASFGTSRRSWAEKWFPSRSLGTRFKNPKPKT